MGGDDDEKSVYSDALDEHLGPFIGGSGRKIGMAMARGSRKHMRKWNAKRRPQRSKEGKGRRKGSSTLSMRRHHHATFRHLIHDALLRLKYRRRKSKKVGFTQNDMIRNIQKHYRIKLGKKFRTNYQQSLDKLCKRKKLISMKGLGKTIYYKLADKFIKEFRRLRVYKGAAKRRYQVEIRRKPKRRRSKSRGRSRDRRRSSSRGSSRSKDPIRKYVKRLFAKKKRKGSTRSTTGSQSSGHRTPGKRMRL
jgi:hypothetical protein